jgi:hypothetical protein
MSIMNGNGSATGRPRQSARSLQHQHLDKRQLAAKLACVLEGDVELVPTARQLARWFGVNETYIRTVRAMSPEKRHAIASGKDSTSLSALVHASSLPLLPKPTANAKLDDSALFAVVHEVGIDKILAVAAEVEAQAH